LIPPKPNALTAARLGCPGPRRGHGLGWRSTSNGEPAIPSPGAGLSKFAVGGSVPLCSANSALVTAAAPAAVSRCPTVDFTEPITPRPAPPNPSHKVFRLANSTASPTGVPVAWHSTISTSEGDHLARR
jgi:hypothetical protein